MTDRYPVFGFSNVLPVHLGTFESASQADGWIKKYIRWGNWGGYDSIAIYEMSEQLGETEDNIVNKDSPIKIHHKWSD